MPPSSKLAYISRSPQLKADGAPLIYSSLDDYIKLIASFINNYKWANRGQLNINANGAIVEFANFCPTSISHMHNNGELQKKAPRQNRGIRLDNPCAEDKY